MAYNKASAEKQWRTWKEAEEKKLRKLGVNEDTIQHLNTYDWEEFKRERRYREWVEKGMPGATPAFSDSDMEIPVRNMESLLESIENPSLHDVLKATDKQTLAILLLKIEGFSGSEIAALMGIAEYAVNMRMYRLRKRLEKFF